MVKYTSNDLYITTLGLKHAPHFEVITVHTGTRAHSIQLRIWNIYVKLGIMIWLILQTVSGTTKVWYFYVSTTSTTNVVQVWYQKAASHIFWIYLVLFNWWASKWFWAEQKLPWASKWAQNDPQARKQLQILKAYTFTFPMIYSKSIYEKVDFL